MTIKPKVSIIVPVYNAQNTLRKCIESILSQSFPDFELLLINDGSEDNSDKICDEYALSDGRIKVIHQENRGIGETRQLGISLTKGEYSIHVDPDDYVDSEMLLKMLSKIEGIRADILIADFYVEGDKFSYIDKQSRFRKFGNNDFLIRKIVSGELHGAYWNKLIRHNIYSEFDVEFSNLNFCEDQLVFLQLLLKGAKVAFINEAFYHYIQHDSSETHRLGKEFIEKKLSPYHKILKRFVSDMDLNLYNTNRYFFYNYLTNNNVDIDFVRYLSPESYGDLNKSYLPIGQKNEILKQMNASKFRYFIGLATYMWMKMKKKI